MLTKDLLYNIIIKCINKIINNKFLSECVLLLLIRML